MTDFLASIYDDAPACPCQGDGFAFVVGVCGCFLHEVSSLAHTQDDNRGVIQGVGFLVQGRGNGVRSI